MVIARRILAVLGLLLLATAAALMLWPLHADGVRGNAFRPRYTSFGVEAYAPLPTHPTHADFVRLGITPPHDVVHDRRVLSAGIAGGGAVLLLSAALLPSRRPE